MAKNDRRFAQPVPLAEQRGIDRLYRPQQRDVSAEWNALLLGLTDIAIQVVALLEDIRGKPYEDSALYKRRTKARQ